MLIFSQLQVSKITQGIEHMNCGKMAVKIGVKCDHSHSAIDPKK